MSKHQVSKWIQKLTIACDGDAQHAKRQLEWLKEKVIYDYRKSIPITHSLSSEEQAQLDIYVNQRVNEHKPLQYILGTQPFCNLDIVTRPPTLIPRWETEEWVYKLISLLNPHLNRTQKSIKMLDICTGSGCIALALAKHLPQDSIEIVGLDISTKAIQLANDNLIVHQSSIQNKVQFQQMDILKDTIPDLSSYNIIVSNPPYITHGEYAELDPDVKDWESPLALVTDDQGTKIHNRVIEVAKHCHHSFDGTVPRLIMEMGGTHQIELLSKRMRENRFSEIHVWKDLADKDRVITGY